MKISYLKFHQPVCIGTNYVSHVVADDRTSIEWSQGIATIDVVGLKELYLVLSGNLEHMKVSREEFDNKPKMGRPKLENK